MYARGREGASSIISFLEFKAVSFVILASRAEGPASHGRRNAPAADPEAGSAKDR